MESENSVTTKIFGNYMETNEGAKELFKLTTLTGYRNNGREHIFPSDASLDWFIRKNREHLIKNNALLMPAGRKLINQDAFDLAVIEIGKITAEKYR